MNKTPFSFKVTISGLFNRAFRLKLKSIKQLDPTKNSPNPIAWAINHSFDCIYVRIIRPIISQ